MILCQLIISSIFNQTFLNWDLVSNDFYQVLTRHSFISFRWHVFLKWFFYQLLSRCLWAAGQVCLLRSAHHQTKSSSFFSWSIQKWKFLHLGDYELFHCFLYSWFWNSLCRPANVNNIFVCFCVDVCCLEHQMLNVNCAQKSPLYIKYRISCGDNNACNCTHELHFTSNKISNVNFIKLTLNKDLHNQITLLYQISKHHSDGGGGNPLFYLQIHA